MDFREYVRVLRKRWLLVAACVIVGTAAAAAYVLTSTKMYESSTQVFVASASATDNSQLAQGNTFAEARVQSYTSIPSSPKVTVPVIAQLGLPMTPDQLAREISADAPTNKVLVNIHVRDKSAQQAARLANAVAAQFSTAVEELETTSPTGAPVKLTVIHPAKVPSSAASPQTRLDIGLGLVLGLIVGIGLAVMREVFDTVVRSVADLEDAVDIPVLGMVAFDKRASRNPLALRADPHGRRAEAFRHLRTNLQFIDVDSQPRIIAITSAVSGEGKSSTALNLAASLAEAGFRVCLIEADLRRPTLAKTLGLVSEAGFTSVLVGKAAVDDVVQNAGQNLAVLTAGVVPPNPSELLASQHARAVIRHVADQVDYTILDTAPLLPVADGAEVATMADATLLVVRAGSTHKDQVVRSLEAVERVGKSLAGAVLNMASTKGPGSDYGYYYYGTYAPDQRVAEPSSAAPAASRRAMNGSARGRRGAVRPGRSAPPVPSAPSAAAALPTEGEQDDHVRAADETADATASRRDNA